MSTTRFQVPANVKQFGRRTGYAVTVLLNLALLFIAINLLESGHWGRSCSISSASSSSWPWSARESE